MYDEGFALSGALGFTFDNVRVEGELSYRRNGMDRIVVPDLGATIEVEGDVSVPGRWLEEPRVVGDGELVGLDHDRAADLCDLDVPPCPHALCSIYAGSRD